MPYSNSGSLVLDKTRFLNLIKKFLKRIKNLWYNKSISNTKSYSKQNNYFLCEKNGAVRIRSSLVAM